MSLRTSLRRAGGVVRVHAPRQHWIGWRFAHSDADNYVYKQAHDEFAKDQIEGFARSLKKSRNKRDDILAYYPSVASQVRWSLSNNPKPIITKASATYVEHLHTVVETLAMSGQGSDLKCIEQILKDLPIVFLLDPSPEIHTTIIRGLVKNGNMFSALLWLKTMSTKPGQLQPTLSQYHLLLESCITSTSPQVSLKFMKSAVKVMRDTGCQPTHDTYAILIRYLWSKPNVVLPPTIFETLIQEMSEHYLPLNQQIADLLYEAYADRGLMKLADQTLQTYRKSVPTTLITPDQIRDARWLDSLSRESYRTGVNGALTLFKDLQKDGAVGTADVLKALLRGSTTTEDLMKAQEATGIQATAVHWSMLTSKIARRGRLPHALSIYKDSREAGITPTLSVSGPLIRAFCLVGTEDSSDEAFSLYQDLTAANEPSSSTTQNTGPDVAIYQSMLSGLSLIPNSTKALDIANILLADMGARDIPLNGMGQDVISIRIRNASDEAEAYEIYQDLKHTVQGLGFVKVIDAFCALSHRGGLHVPSLEKVFTIIGDMKRSGQSINPSIYTMLLGHFNEIALRIDEQSTSSEFVDRYCDTVRRIHDLLVLESFSPEAPLWNLLMDTYRRVERHHDVYRVWEQIFLSGKYDHESVNIVLDSCGLSQDLSAARNVYTRLNEGGYAFTKENWDSWVECLCRTNQVNEAVKTVCLEMSRRGAQPDETTVRALLYFTEKSGLAKEVMVRIERHLPQVWGKLPVDLKEAGSK
ncbi:pentatricopeptide repeat-containing protein [Armillaria nabsnona]|nr:pentatricopeptide repeat-containing protein [Armillaria nabsnona]